MACLTKRHGGCQEQTNQPQHECSHQCLRTTDALRGGGEDECGEVGRYDGLLAVAITQAVGVHLRAGMVLYVPKASLRKLYGTRITGR